MHLDFLGPINNKVYLVIVDAYSKWLECFDVSSAYGSSVVIGKLCEVMSRFGLIRNICTDNGTSFVSTEFNNFCRNNGIIHLTTPTYSPSSNGQAESSVKIIKKALKAFIISKVSAKDFNVKLNEFLFNYRNSEHSTTGRSPAEILFGRKLRNRLDLLDIRKPISANMDLESVVKDNQCLQSKLYSGIRKVKFTKNEIVLVKVYKQKKTYWTKGIIENTLGNSLYEVRLLDQNNGSVIKRHVNQLLKFKGEGESPQAERSSHGGEVMGTNEDLPTELPPILLSSSLCSLQTEDVTQPAPRDVSSENVDASESAEHEGTDSRCCSPSEQDKSDDSFTTPSPPPRAQNERRDMFIFEQ